MLCETWGFNPSRQKVCYTQSHYTHSSARLTQSRTKQSTDYETDQIKHLTLHWYLICLYFSFIKHVWRSHSSRTSLTFDLWLSKKDLTIKEREKVKGKKASGLGFQGWRRFVSSSRGLVNSEVDWYKKSFISKGRDLTWN